MGEKECVQTELGERKRKLLKNHANQIITIITLTLTPLAARCFLKQKPKNKKKRKIFFFFLKKGRIDGNLNEK